MTEKHSSPDSAPDLSRIAYLIDDIEVDANGMCRWSDVANAQTLIRMELRRALAQAAPVHEQLLRLADGIADHGSSITYPSRQAANEVRSVVRELAAALRSAPPQAAPDTGAVELLNEVSRYLHGKSRMSADSLANAYSIRLRELAVILASTPPQAAHQPIETAPKDGTHILAWRVTIGIRVTNLTNPPTVVHWFDDPDDPGFYTSVNERAPDYPFKATHWMPLPPGPSLSRPQRSESGE